MSERTTWQWEYAVREHDGKITVHSVRYCVSCQRPTLADYKWRRLSPLLRGKLTSEGYQARGSAHFCRSCYDRMRRAGIPREHVQVDAEIVAEEWSALADPNLSTRENVRRLAPKLGMTEAALERAIQRLWWAA